MDSCIELIVRSYAQSETWLSKWLDGLTQEEAAYRGTEECNNILWLLWHFTRGEDHFVNVLIQHGEEVYETGGWQQKMGTPSDRGPSYTLEQVQAWPEPKLEDMRGYHNAVREKTLAYLDSITSETLAEVVQPDGRLPTVTAILSRSITEVALHIGQIGYLRGIQRGINK